jgi:hypothetical protein
MGRIALAGIVVIVLGGCSSFSADSTAPPAASDGGAEASTTAQPRLEDPSFDTAGCGAWESPNAVKASETKDAYNGSDSCRVCAEGTATPWGIRQRFPRAVPAGTYEFKVWLEAPGGVTYLPATQVFVQVNVLDDQGARIDGSETLAPLLVGPRAWTEYRVKRALTEGQRLEVAVVAKAPGGCLQVDNAFLTYAP